VAGLADKLALTTLHHLQNLTAPFSKEESLVQPATVQVELQDLMYLENHQLHQHLDVGHGSLAGY
jgi:hypothetical protein